MLKTIKRALGMSGDGDEIIGSISTFAGTFAPQGYFDCDGRMLTPKEYPALFSLISTMYGGDGINTFALPDLRPFDNDGQPDTGLHRRVDWAKVGKPRQIICYAGMYPYRP
jgi:microcystin-dependent protein